ncbi:MAG: 50S ribosomal protein L11 methyltransferase [Acidobacteria bacterium]|nr:50S ribosomal protein L11 methyltransferase [Acidobacteriota bacterium]
MDWFAIEITVLTEAAEAVEFALNELDALGTEINNLGRLPTATLTVAGYFNDPPDDDALAATLAGALEIYGFSGDAVTRVERRAVANQDWLAEWKKHWKPTETDRFVIAPTWETVADTGRIVIRIEPSMAFGTGTHETTRLCLRAVERLYRPEMSFLDVGTGTGILAIAAAKIKAKGRSPESEVLSPESDAKENTEDSRLKTQDSRLKPRPSITGCDTDADSIAIAKENADTNDTPEIELFVGSIDARTAVFDFVCANLTADVILPILPLLVEKSKRFLVLSGILREQETWVTDALRGLGIADCAIAADGEWISVTIEKL